MKNDFETLIEIDVGGKKHLELHICALRPKLHSLEFTYVMSAIKTEGKKDNLTLEWILKGELYLKSF